MMEHNIYNFTLNSTGFYKYEYKLPFERDHLLNEFLFFESHWTLSIWLSCLYIITVFIGQTFMEGRERFELRKELAIWNMCLAVFSAIGFVRLLPEFLTGLEVAGVKGLMCSVPSPNSVAPYWYYLFALSKIWEFGDTVFIILRKQKLIFLHWYHHVVTCILTWYACGAKLGLASYTVVTNIFVHAIMYTYFGLKAMKFNIPLSVSMAITAIQFIQMVVGVSVMYMGYLASYEIKQCSLQPTDALAYLAMYLSYLFLFGEFFYRSYLRGPNLKKKLKSS